MLTFIRTQQETFRVEQIINAGRSALLSYQDQIDLEFFRVFCPIIGNRRCKLKKIERNSGNGSFVGIYDYVVFDGIRNVKHVTSIRFAHSNGKFRELKRFPTRTYAA